jgi:hypothetical protein
VARSVGRQRDEALWRGEAGEPFVADRLQVREADDRLEDGADRPRREQLAEVVGGTRRRRMG